MIMKKDNETVIMRKKKPSRNKKLLGDIVGWLVTADETRIGPRVILSPVSHLLSREKDVSQVTQVQPRPHEAHEESA